MINAMSPWLRITELADPRTWPKSDPAA